MPLPKAQTQQIWFIRFDFLTSLLLALLVLLNQKIAIYHSLCYISVYQNYKASSLVVSKTFTWCEGGGRFDFKFVDWLSFVENRGSYKGNVIALRISGYWCKLPRVVLHKDKSPLFRGFLWEMIYESELVIASLVSRSSSTIYYNAPCTKFMPNGQRALKDKFQYI